MHCALRVKAIGEDKLKVIAAKLITRVRKNATIDWTLRERVTVTGTALGCRLTLSGDRYAARRCFAG